MRPPEVCGYDVGIRTGHRDALEDRIMSKPSDITGRDTYIIAKALAYGITTIDHLPKERQEGSDRDDMERLLAAMLPDDPERLELMRSVRAHMGFEPFFKHPADHLSHVN